MNDSTDIGKKIASFRKLKRVTQSDLAKSIGVSKGHISAIEEGRKQPNIRTLAMIAEYLNVEIEVFFE